MGWSYKEWYDENKETLNTSRRERYEKDPEYRTRVQQWNKDSRQRLLEKKRLEEKLRVVQAKGKKSARSSSSSKPVRAQGQKRGRKGDQG